MTAQAGVIGIGAMGMGVAKRLLARGYGVHVRDIRRGAEDEARAAGFEPTVVGSLAGRPMLGDSSDVIETTAADTVQAVRDLLPVYAQVMPAALLRDLQACAALSDERFALPDELWVTLIYNFALAYHRRALDREHLVKSLTPLYLGWVASFACQTANEDAAQVEERIERLCLVYEQLKPALIGQWPVRVSEKR